MPQVQNKEIKGLTILILYYISYYQIKCGIIHASGESVKPKIKG